MANIDENEEKIAMYIAGRMNASEEEAFMQQLGIDAVLREQYEDELLVRSLLEPEDDEAVISDSMPEETATAEGEKTKKNSIIRWFVKYENIAASALIVISAAIAFLFLKNTSKEISTISGTHKILKDTLAHITPSHDESSLPARKDTTDKVFKRFYKRYSAGEKDPVELSEYYEAYQKGQSAKVLAATKTDYEVMGVSEKSKTLQLYLNLYKGLVYLENNHSKRAIQQFDSVVHSASKADNLYFTAKWYSCLAWLKEGDLSMAAKIAKSIAALDSPYKLDAKHLSEQLNVK